MLDSVTVHRFVRNAALTIPRLRRFYDYSIELNRQVGQLRAELSAIRRQEELQTKQASVDWAAGMRPTEAEANIDPALAPEALIRLIRSGADLNGAHVRNLAAGVEGYLSNMHIDRLGIHREIGKAIFARSVDLYCGHGLPASLTRYTYPACVSILLNTHCNASCFFCRESDFKGTSIEATEVLKLDSAIRHARVVDLTGWGEPFLYPEFEWVVRHILSINPSPRLIQVTTNGSLLSERWGDLLAGKINMIIVSLNAATSGTYEQQMRYKNRQFTFDRVISNLRAFLPRLTSDDRERIDLHMVANSDNFREIPQFVQIAADLGVPQVSIGNYISAQKQYMHKTLWNVKQEYNEALAQGRELADKLGIRISGRRFFSEEGRVMGATNCMAPFEAMFIEPSGKTAPCCFMGNERIENVYKDGFEAVWFSDTMNKLRQDRFLPPCKVCTIFSPFDEQTSHISATLLAEPTLESRRDRRVDEVVLQ